MARVTVEDCVDKVPNRFELVLLAAHRARSIADGSAVTIPVNDDKNPVIALREIAEKTIPPEDMRESLIHSIQKNVEVDEPEAVAAPLLPPERRAPVLGRDDQSSDSVVDVMTEEPPRKNHPLFSLPNVTLTPHSAGPTWDNWRKAYRNGFDNIQRMESGRAPFWVIPELREVTSS